MFNDKSFEFSEAARRETDAQVWHAICKYAGRWRRVGQRTLRISIQENDNSIGFTLVGRLAGPWVGELERAWKDIAPRLDEKKLSLDVCDLTYSDSGGKKVLRDMFVKSHAEFVTSNDWSHHLAEEIKNSNSRYAKGRA
jgi:hypothetical protein